MSGGGGGAARAAAAAAAAWHVIARGDGGGELRACDDGEARRRARLHRTEKQLHTLQQQLALSHALLLTCVVHGVWKAVGRTVQLCFTTEKWRIVAKVHLKG